VVVTVHDLEALSDRRPTIDLGRLVRRLADRLIVHNRASQRELLEGFAVSPSKVDVVPAGHDVSPPAKPDARAAARASLGIAAEAPVLLFFGRVKQAKGLDLLLEALPHLVAARPSLRLIVAGRAEAADERAYRAQVAKLGVEEICVLRFGFVAPEEVGSLFAATDLVVLPYRRIYQSAVLLLAMGQGTPVVASDLPATREVVRDGVNGFLFRAGAAESLAEVTLAALGDPQRRAAVAHEALRTIEEGHAWPRIAALTIESYRRALGQAGE